jgi:hypothetical protein
MSPPLNVWNVREPLRMQPQRTLTHVPRIPSQWLHGTALHIMVTNDKHAVAPYKKVSCFSRSRKPISCKRKKKLLGLSSPVNCSNYMPRCVTIQTLTTRKHHERKGTFSIRQNYVCNAVLEKKNSMASVHEVIVPTEQPPLVGDVNANFCR